MIKPITPPTNNDDIFFIMTKLYHSSSPLDPSTFRGLSIEWFPLRARWDSFPTGTVQVSYGAHLRLSLDKLGFAQVPRHKLNLFSSLSDFQSSRPLKQKTLKWGLFDLRGLVEDVGTEIRRNMAIMIARIPTFDYPTV